MEHSKPDETILPVFFKIGQILAEARKEQGLTLKQVADVIHIRRKYLLDLEEGRFSELPGRVYILGFIRTYARLLELDGEELIRQMEGIPSFPAFEGSQPAFALTPSEGPGPRLLAVSVILTVLTAAGGYFFLRPSGNGISLSPHKNSHSPGPAEKFSDPPGIQDEEAGIENSASVRVTGQPATSAVTFPTPEAKIQPDGIKDDVVLKATEPSWLEVRNDKGEALFMKVLQRGETYTIPNQPGIVINIGNAGGIDAYYGDLKLPPLGARGKVKRGIPLEFLKK